MREYPLPQFYFWAFWIMLVVQTLGMIVKCLEWFA